MKSLTPQRFEQRTPGRFGFHWHGGTDHTYCVDPAQPTRDHHYAGTPVDIFDASGRVTVALTGDSPITCMGLTSIRH